MSTPAIVVENLAKRYRIGSLDAQTDTIAGSVTSIVTRPLRNLRRLRKLSSFDGNEPQAQDVIWALEDISFEVQRGEIVGLIGPNGAGKSTLLKILTRITEPTSGRALLNGRVSSLLEVGTGFHEELTGRENVYLNGAVLGMKRSEIKGKFDEIVDFAGVDRFINTPVKRYSSGMKVRLAFSVAAHLEPEILLVDEVLAVGDVEFQRKSLGRMEKVASEGRTVILVSHNMTAINRLCSRALLLESGKLTVDSTADEATSIYLTGGVGEAGTLRCSGLSISEGNGLVVDSVQTIDGENDEPGHVFPINHALNIRISYKTDRPSMRFRCSILLFTRGVHAFTSLQPEERIHERAGQYSTTVQIPRNLLAEGDYVVGIEIFESRVIKEVFASANDVLMFQIFDPMDGTTARGNYAQIAGMAGVVRPKLEWTQDPGTTRVSAGGIEDPGQVD
jgi:lipopolysaccharide transport system ATP-binding protein